MEQESCNITDSNDLTYILIGTLIGIGLFSLPNDVVASAKQDGWLSVMIGGVYPLFAVFVSGIIIRKYPNDSILVLSRKYMGKIIGNVFNFIYMMGFWLIIVSITSGLSHLIQIYGVSFMSHTKICSIAVMLAGYGAYKGINVLGRINKYIFFLILMLILLSITALKYGRILNVQPVFGSGFVNILKSAKETFYSYALLEVVLVLHPFVKDKKGIIKSALKAVLITILIYTWVVFITIYFLGIDIIPKSFWSFIMVTESVQIPIVNNFRFIFMFLWLLAIFRIISNIYFVISLILSDLTKIDRKKVCIFIYPIIFYLSTRFQNQIVRKDFLDKWVLFAVAFNIAYISIIAVFTGLDKKKPSSR